MPNEEAIVGWTIDEILRGLMGVEDPTDEKTAQSARELRRLRNETPRDNEMEENERLRLIEELSQSVDKDPAGGRHRRCGPRIVRTAVQSRTRTVPCVHTF